MFLLEEDTDCIVRIRFIEILAKTWKSESIGQVIDWIEMFQAEGTARVKVLRCVYTWGVEEEQGIYCGWKSKYK